MPMFYQLNAWYIAARDLGTGKNNGFPFLDILGYLKNTPQKSQIWQSETSPNQGIPN